MKVIDFVNFLKTPADRDVIARWTAPPGPHGYALDLPPPPHPDRFTFLALGDTGDSAGMGSQMSPQDAVADCLAADAAVPGSAGDGIMVIHTGDVVYMAGERRLYDRNFRRPYSPFLTPESTVDNLVFRMPFLPVPGNHDYYDFAGWATTLSRTPFVGAGVAALARELFAFQIPEGGSDMGGAYMQAFVDRNSGGRPYEPGKFTRLPNRYYRYRVGDVDFFALDSNTLETPPPSANLDHERKAAEQHVRDLEKRARALGREIRRDESAVDNWLGTQRGKLAADKARLAALRETAGTMAAALERLSHVLSGVAKSAPVCAEVADTAAGLARRWRASGDTLSGTKRTASVEKALEAVDAAGDDCCGMLEALERCFVELPEGTERRDLLAARDHVAEVTRQWREETTGSPPPELCRRVQQLTAQALDVQRQLALERRRVGRRPDDHDAAQLEWFRNALEESVRERPDGWRVVVLHQPLHTTIGNHSENADVIGVRDCLTPLFRDKVHLVLAGHSHAFEWFRSRALPTTALIVTGGGGQPWLWRSILDPRRFRHYRHLYRSLRGSGVTECVIAGHGPAAPDGEAGPIYNYVRVEVTPDVITVFPIGVRRLEERYRREAPMPVYHVPEFPPGDPPVRPQWFPRVLESIEIRRGQPPRPRWR